MQVRELENIPVFNAGRGSVLTWKGTVETEASIMDGGSTMNCGAVFPPHYGRQRHLSRSTGQK